MRGLSLVETVIIVALFSILMIVISESVASFYRLNAYTIAQAYQVDAARRGVDLLVRDLREMTFADDGTFPLVSMGTTSVGFFSDIDRDSSVEYVVYRLASTTLMKYVYNATGTPPTYSTSTPAETSTLSEYVQNSLQNVPMFVYYDEDGKKATATTTATDIRYVGVNIIVNIDPVRDPGEYSLRSSAALRNLIQS
jgi:Tfp pilus assembly protein PilW